MQGWKRVAVVLVAVVCAAAAIGLTAVAFAVDLETANQVASIVGALVGLAGFVVSAWALLRSARETVEASNGAVAAGNDIGRVVKGNNNRATGALPTPPSAAGLGTSSKADGLGSVAAGGSIGEVIGGDGNTT
ncbi:hypothetical protein ACIPSJ_41810 [Streptomyces sp. NPDC090088]|uniref:hypothetical protein n=1 Tax=Streptomyces sp. NPDC090088 TaxID=3365944 RepID=UPI0038084C33